MRRDFGRCAYFFRRRLFLVTCQCQQCCETPDKYYTDQYRHEAEVREVMRRFETKEQIKSYLFGVEKQRGFEAMQRLRMDLLKEWNKRKGGSQ